MSGWATERGARVPIRLLGIATSERSKLVPDLPKLGFRGLSTFGRRPAREPARGLGADVHNGGAGFDYARYDDATSAVVVDLSTGWGTAGDALNDRLTFTEFVHPLCRVEAVHFRSSRDCEEFRARRYWDELTKAARHPRTLRPQHARAGFQRAVERDAEHPVAIAIVASAANRTLSVPAATEFQSIPGRGVPPTRASLSPTSPR